MKKEQAKILVVDFKAKKLARTIDLNKRLNKTEKAYLERLQDMEQQKKAS